MSAATRAGFTGGLVVDYPNSKKAKKFYLCLMTGPSASSSGKQQMELPAAYGTEEGTVQYEKGRKREERSHSRKGKKKDASSKDWILRKKSLYRQRGKEGVPNDSKYVSHSTPILLFLPDPCKNKESCKLMMHSLPLFSRFTGRKRKAQF